MLLCSILKNYDFTLTSASQTMQLNAAGCTPHLIQIIWLMTFKYGWCSGVADWDPKQWNAVLQFKKKKKKNTLSAFWKKKVGKWGSENSVHSGRRKFGNEALKILLCFSATLLCDAEFSAKLLRCCIIML